LEASEKDATAEKLDLPSSPTVKPTARSGVWNGGKGNGAPKPEET
jgi:hypothetical protein